jgi:hypothetical protein
VWVDGIYRAAAIGRVTHILAYILEDRNGADVVFLECRGRIDVT